DRTYESRGHSPSSETGTGGPAMILRRILRDTALFLLLWSGLIAAYSVAEMIGGPAPPAPSYLQHAAAVAAGSPHVSVILFRCGAAAGGGLMGDPIRVRASSWGSLFSCAYQWEGVHLLG